MPEKRKTIRQAAEKSPMQGEATNSRERSLHDR
jgi:hypothetical protein